MRFLSKYALFVRDTKKIDVLVGISVCNLKTCMQIPFDKYSSQGNDFILIDDKDHGLAGNPSDFIRSVCRRRLSVGADGVMFINAEDLNVRVRYYNADGKPGEMCGNGARAAVDFLFRRGLVERKGFINVWDSRLACTVDENNMPGVELQLKSNEMTAFEFARDDEHYTGFFCNSGVPHFVIFDSDLHKHHPIDFARSIRHSEKFGKEGANVNFVNVVDEHSIEIISFERGVEDFTLACGTGSAAAVFTGMREKGLACPVSVTSFGGTVTISASDTSETLWLWGKVDKVYSGIMDIDF